MWIRASYTVENAVIVPVFSMIIILIISFTCNIHDEIIKENVISQIGIENELSEMVVTEEMILRKLQKNI